MPENGAPKSSEERRAIASSTALATAARSRREREVDRPVDRPNFLHDDYGRNDIPVVRRERGPRTSVRVTEGPGYRRYARSTSPVHMEIERSRSPNPVVSDEKEKPADHESGPPSSVGSGERNVDGTNARGRRDRSPGRESPPRPIREVDEVIWDVTRSKDVTIHLELDVSEDLEPDLDEFSRLTRLGNLYAAKQFFQDKLEEHIDNPYVFVHYAQMLIEMGDYKNIKALDVPHSLQSYPNEVLLSNWYLVSAFRSLHTDGLSRHWKLRLQTYLVSLRKFSDNNPAVTSTECQLLSLSLRILEGFQDNDEYYVGQFPWKAIYENLLRDGRIWDFNDVFIGAICYYGRHEACRQIIGRGLNPDQIIDRIIGDWSTASHDESTNLALLEIFTFLAFAAPLSPQILVDTKRYVDKAGELASSIVQNHAVNLKSRSYIRWILAKVAVESYRDLLAMSLSPEVNGMFLVHFNLFLYVPVASEAPDWNVLWYTSKLVDTLQTALRAAKQLGDYETEALCLQQLIVHSQDPTEFFAELIHLQKSVQNDMEGCLRTCLTKYLICRDKRSSDALRDEILLVDEYADFDSDLVWARHMILRALAHSDHEASFLLDEARIIYRQSKTKNLRDFMERNELAGASVWPRVPDRAQRYSADKSPSSGEQTKRPKRDETGERVRVERRRGSPEVVVIKEHSPLRRQSEKNKALVLRNPRPKERAPPVVNSKDASAGGNNKMFNQPGIESPKQKLSEIFVTIDEDGRTPAAPMFSAGDHGDTDAPVSDSDGFSDGLSSDGHEDKEKNGFSDKNTKQNGRHYPSGEESERGSRITITPSTMARRDKWHHTSEPKPEPEISKSRRSPTDTAEFKPPVRRYTYASSDAESEPEVSRSPRVVNSSSPEGPMYIEVD